VQHGGFAAAARHMRLSSSAVSKYVIEREQSLGNGNCRLAEAAPSEPDTAISERSGLSPDFVLNSEKYLDILLISR